MLEQGGSFAGVNRKVQLKPLRWAALEEGSAEQPHVVEALLILKHGGVLTHAGRQQVRLHECLFIVRASQQSCFVWDADCLQKAHIEQADRCIT